MRRLMLILSALSVLLAFLAIPLQPALAVNYSISGVLKLNNTSTVISYIPSGRPTGDYAGLYVTLTNNTAAARDLSFNWSVPQAIRDLNEFTGSCPKQIGLSPYFCGTWSVSAHSSLTVVRWLRSGGCSPVIGSVSLTLLDEDSVPPKAVLATGSVSYDNTGVYGTNLSCEDNDDWISQAEGYNIGPPVVFKFNRNTNYTLNQEMHISYCDVYGCPGSYEATFNWTWDSTGSYFSITSAKLWRDSGHVNGYVTCTVNSAIKVTCPMTNWNWNSYGWPNMEVNIHTGPNVFTGGDYIAGWYDISQIVGGTRYLDMRVTHLAKLQ